MDARLVAWGRAVKARQRNNRHAVPPLWLFTDDARLPDPLAAAARLPKGLAGVVLRHDAAPHRAALALALARICRMRRLALVIAGDPHLAARLRCGHHLRAGRGRSAPRGLTTSSAHSYRELLRAARAGAHVAFLSPAFPTASHPGAPGLGVARWSALARRACLPVAALGGVDGQSIRRLPGRFCHAAGAIGALA